MAVGLLIGWAIQRRRDPKDRIERAFRAQGMLPDGSPHPDPPSLARLSNGHRLALFVGSLAVVAFVVGAVPRLVYPEPYRRCLDPSDDVLADLRGVLRPGVVLRGVQVRREIEMTVVAAVVEAPDTQILGLPIRHGGVAAWQHAPFLDAGVHPLDDRASHATPGLGQLGGGGLGWDEWEARVDAARRCAEAAVDDGETVAVPPLPVGDPTEGIRLSSVDDPLPVTSVSCSTGDAAITAESAQWRVSITAQPPSIHLTVEEVGRFTTASYTGRVASISDGFVTVDGVLQDAVDGGHPPVEVVGTVACPPTQ